MTVRGVEDVIVLMRSQQARIVALEAMVEALSVRVGVLADRLDKEPGVGGGSKTSSNSSLPPSLDVDRERLMREAKKRSTRTRSGRNPGKQPGARGAHLARVSEPDRVLVHEPSCCQGCGSDLSGVAGRPVGGGRQVFDLPPVVLETVEHRVATKTCGCGHETVGVWPEGVGGPVQWGPNVTAMAVYLQVHHHVPAARTGELLAAMGEVNP